MGDNGLGQVVGYFASPFLRSLRAALMQLADLMVHLHDRRGPFRCAAHVCTVEEAGQSGNR